jgi:hypothetical protein
MRVLSGALAAAAVAVAAFAAPALAADDRPPTLRNDPDPAAADPE